MSPGLQVAKSDPSYVPSAQIMSSVAPKIGLVAFTFLMMLALAECALRVVGFRYQLAPEKVEFGWPDPVTLEEQYRPDSELFWVPKTYDATLARASNGTPLDIAFLGDSDLPPTFVPAAMRVLG